MTTVSKKEKPKRIREAKAMMINRSIGGNIVIFLFLALASIFMLLPIVYTVVTAFKPMNEIFLYPPRFWVKKSHHRQLCHHGRAGGGNVGAV